MGEEEKWPLYDGYCSIYNGKINYCKLKDKKEKIIKCELSNIISMEKELKDDWVRVQFNYAGKVIKKEFKFKNTGDGEKFILLCFVAALKRVVKRPKARAIRAI